MKRSNEQPNILYLMCDQYRFDCIQALGNSRVKTPNIDRIASKGVVFDHAYSTCPVCIPARYTLRTGCEPNRTGCYQNEPLRPMDGLPENIYDRCGEYLSQAMSNLGYRTFGIGKFHTIPAMDYVGFDVQMNTEEMWRNKEEREKDAYARFIYNEHPEYNHIEQLHGERTNMYYMPQTSALPAELTVEAFVADKAVEQIRGGDEKPYFGFVSFIGPHPPLAPPIPYNRMYNPDAMPVPIKSDIAIDFMDEQIPFMNYLTWSNDLSESTIQNLWAHYFGEISYIDSCIGKILDEIERSESERDTVICFFADHGDHMGDHHAWQKESFFEASARIPFILYCPEKWEAQISHQLTCLTDLFGIATELGGKQQLKDGWPVLGALSDSSKEREELFAVYGRPGTRQFKIMCRWKQWKYIYFANGGLEQLFCTDEDPNELINYDRTNVEIKNMLRKKSIDFCHRPGLQQAIEGEEFIAHEFKPRDLVRLMQFDMSADIKEFEYNYDLNNYFSMRF